MDIIVNACTLEKWIQRAKFVGKELLFQWTILTLSMNSHALTIKNMAYVSSFFIYNLRISDL